MKLVSKRNHFPSLEQMAEDYARMYEKAPIKDVLMVFGKHLLNSTVWAYKTAAGNGIDQALALIEDPECFETKKRRREMDLKRSAEEREKHRQASIDAKMSISRVPKKKDGEPWKQ